MRQSFRHEYDRDGSCSKMGASAEDLFQELCKEGGIPLKRASELEDKRGVDFWIKMGLEDWEGIDIKSSKRKSRNDEVCNDTIWIEILNVNGNKGWLEKEKTKYIAFQEIDGFVVVEREKLKEKVYSLLKEYKAKQVSYARDAKYNFYTRKGRNDLLTVIDLSDLKAVDDAFLL